MVESATENGNIKHYRIGVCSSENGREREYIDKKSVERSRCKLRESYGVDNQSAVKLEKNPEFHKRTKHIDVRFHFIRE